MANILNTAGRAKKAALAPGWMEGISRKHPDRPFYFNENTGEDSWTPPLEEERKSGPKGKKRKNEETEEEEFSDASPAIAQKLLNKIRRPKLKPKSRIAASSPTKESSNDTPEMRKYREKMAQRKVGAESKKSGAKTADQKKVNKTVEDSTPQTPTRRSQRSSSVVSSSTSVSISSDVSDAPSMGTEIVQRYAASASRASRPSSAKLGETRKLPRIPKVSASRSDKPETNLTSSYSKTDDNPYVDILRKVSKKNSAHERMSKLRRSLNGQKNKIPLASKDDKPSNKSKSNFSTPFSPKDAQTRLFYLESRVQSDGGLEVSNVEQHLDEYEDCNRNKSILEKFDGSNLYCEDMEWEPIEDEKIVSEIYSARLHLWEKPTDKTSEISFNVLKPANSHGEKNNLYIVVDTNVFLSNLPFIEEIRDSNSEVFGRPFIVIPWTVLQELDYIKDDKNNTRSQALKYKARKAVEFINRHFTAKHPRFLGQTPTDVQENKEKFQIECPDDEILQTCLQIKESAKSIVLLSYDKNLCTKAMIHDVPILGRNDPLEKIYTLKAPQTTEFLTNSLHAHTEEQQRDNSIVQHELLLADDIMEEGKAVLKSMLSQVVAKEMENLFGSRWEKHVIIHPPWSIVTVLKCALKHWMAAVSESFERKTEPMLRDLQMCIANVPEGGRKLKDVKTFLDKCKDVIQTLDAVKYPTFKEKVATQIDDLAQKCLNSMRDINVVRLQESIGTAEESEEEKRATLAFKVLEDVYAFARDVCGMAADALGLQCAFAYNKFHPFLTTQLALEQHQDIGVNVNNLLQILRVALSNDYENECPNDKIILTLYEVLVTFSSNLKYDELSELTPVDLFCCLKLKRSQLEKGYEQLQELAMHFCRMADSQCS